MMRKSSATGDVAGTNVLALVLAASRDMAVALLVVVVVALAALAEAGSGQAAGLAAGQAAIGAAAGEVDRLGLIVLLSLMFSGGLAFALAMARRTVNRRSAVPSRRSR